MAGPGTILQVGPDVVARMWPHRVRNYKIGIAILGISSVFFCIGLLSEHWLSARYDDKIRDLILNGTIDGMKTRFESTDLGKEDDVIVTWSLWDIELSDSLCPTSCTTGLTLARVLFCAALLMYIINWVLFCLDNCRSVNVRLYRSRRLEYSIIGTGIALVFGILTYFYMFADNIKYVDLNYSWSAGLMWLAVLSLVCSWVFLMCASCSRTSLNQSGTVMSGQPQGVMHVAVPSQPGVQQPGVIQMSPYPPQQVTVIQSVPAQQPQYPVAQPHQPIQQPYYQPPAAQPLLSEQKVPYPQQQVPYPQQQPYPPQQQPYYPPSPQGQMQPPPPYIPSPAYPGPQPMPPPPIGFHPPPGPHPAGGFHPPQESHDYSKASAPPPM